MKKKPTQNFKKNNSSKPRVFVDQNSQENIDRRAKEGTVRGRVVEALPNAMFKVEYENGTKGYKTSQSSKNHHFIHGVSF